MVIMYWLLVNNFKKLIFMMYSTGISILWCIRLAVFWWCLFLHIYMFCLNIMIVICCLCMNWWWTYLNHWFAEWEIFELRWYGWLVALQLIKRDVPCNIRFGFTSAGICHSNIFSFIKAKTLIDALNNRATCNFLLTSKQAWQAMGYLDTRFYLDRNQSFSKIKITAEFYSSLTMIG